LGTTALDHNFESKIPADHPKYQNTRILA